MIIYFFQFYFDVCIFMFLKKSSVLKMTILAIRKTFVADTIERDNICVRPVLLLNSFFEQHPVYFLFWLKRLYQNSIFFLCNVLLHNLIAFIFVREVLKITVFKLCILSQVSYRSCFISLSIVFCNHFLS